MRARNYSPLFFCAALLLGGILSGCDERHEQTKVTSPLNTIKIKPSEVTTRLYYKGVLNPIRSIPVISPVDGYVSNTFFRYGEEVKKGEKLLSIAATRLAATYRQAVTEYLQKKAGLETQTSLYEGDKELYKAGVMSQQDFLNERNAYATAVLNLSQARINMEKILRQANISIETIEKLKLEDVKTVDALLQRTFKNIVIKSPADGVVLIPVGTKSSSGESKPEMLASGANVKAQESLVMLGDPTGYKVNIQVSELQIINIKPGLSALVRGDSFPGVQLNGFVKQVAVQANPNQWGASSGVSMFDVVVYVPNIAKATRKNIRVGMTAKVEILIKQPPRILIPISAIYEKKGKTFVRVLDPVSKQPKPVKVTTGETTVDEVVIVDGLKAGDELVVTEKAAPHDKDD